MFGNLLDQIKEAITGHAEERGGNMDAPGLISQIEGLFGNHAANNSGNVLPASQDPYGDPADQGGGRILPASQDPYGDPADQPGSVLPASQDTYGDPADQR